MKVLLIHNRYQTAGGEETAIAAQMALLKQRGHTVLLHQRDSNEIPTMGALARARAVPRVIYNGHEAQRLADLVAEQRPDIAHIHNVFPLISPAVYRKLHQIGLPIVQTIHNFRFLCPNSFFFTQGQICERCKWGNTWHAVPRRCFRGSALASASYAAAIALHRQWGTFELIDRYITLTRFAADKLVEGGLVAHERIRVLGNFIADPLPAVGDLDAREPSLLYIGRISEEKGVPLLIEAMAHLPPIPLHLLGEGPARAALEARVAAAGWSHIRFQGYVAGDEKFDEMRRASVAVVPSRLYENFPFAILENLAVGTPVVVPRHGAFPHIVAEGVHGRSFAPHDSHDLARTLVQMLDDPALPTMRRHARTLVEQRYSSAAHYDCLRGIYDDLIAARQGKAALRRGVTP